MSRACRLRHRNALSEKAWEVFPTAFSGIFGLKFSLSILSNHPMISGQRTARAAERHYNFAANQRLINFILQHNDWKPCNGKSPGDEVVHLAVIV